jgi:Holliday junction DNA helicase RuvA
MIGKLKGLVDDLEADHVLIDVGGVCYAVHCGARTLASLPARGEAAVLHVETVLRQDQLRLFGFATRLEREWFLLLQTVQGIGAKVALAILSTLSPSELANAIALRDTAMISRSPGVGKKVAERIVTELKNKVPALSGEAGAALELKRDLGEGVAPTAIADAVSALVNLGYGADQAANAVAAATGKAGPDAPAATLIRLGLKELAR